MFDKPVDIAKTYNMPIVPGSTKKLYHNKSVPTEGEKRVTSDNYMLSDMKIEKIKQVYYLSKTLGKPMWMQDATNKELRDTLNNLKREYEGRG